MQNVMYCQIDSKLKSLQSESHNGNVMEGGFKTWRIYFHFVYRSKTNMISFFYAIYVNYNPLIKNKSVVINMFF